MPGAGSAASCRAEAPVLGTHRVPSRGPGSLRRCQPARCRIRWLRARRARRLYRPPGQQYFGCRECWGLSYESRQRHRQEVYENLEKPWRALEALDDAFATGRPTKRLWKALQRWDRLAPRLEAALAEDEEKAA